MLFNSNLFIFIFLPITFILYHLLNYYKQINLAKVFMIFASFVFYAYFKYSLVFILIAYILINYTFYHLLMRYKSKLLLSLGIGLNLSILGYFKYKYFIIDNINNILSLDIINPSILLPLGISFITFQQIAFLSDCYKYQRDIKTLVGGGIVGFINFSLFVSFFPQLIAGPIVHYKQMIPQFINPNNFILRYKNIALGLLFFVIGLFKKVALADYLAPSIDATYKFVESGGVLNLIESWVLTHAYTSQLYFDFSGYCDMAIGLALFFNIKLPYNFNSPYKSLSISEFWQRWHISLGRFLKDYIYIPLGGSRVGKSRQYINLFIVFVISGIWHGAGWGFIVWGSLHGIAICIHKAYMSVFANINLFKNRLNYKLYKVIMWIITFEFINITWVFFRATSINDALSVVKSMFLLHGQIVLSPNMQRLFKDNSLFSFGKWGEHFTIGQSTMLNVVLLMMVFVLVFRASQINIYQKFILKDRYFIFIGLILLWSILQINVTPYIKFILIFRSIYE